MSPPKTFWDRLIGLLWSVRWWFLGLFANRRIKAGGKNRTEAEVQLSRIILETGIRPDAISATTLRGGAAFMVKHQDALEAFVHDSYTEAADEAIAWILLQGDEINPKRIEGAAVMPRRERRGFEHSRRRGGYKNERKKGKTVH